jgi:transcriptional regulator with XRE-family HTH domain
MFPERLKALRKEKKLSQENMGSLLGITRQAYGKYEKNESEPDIATINKLASFFKVSNDFLLGRSDDPTPKSNAAEELSDPKLNIFFKEIKEESPERQQQLMKIWNIIKNEGKEEK